MKIRKTGNLYQVRTTFGTVFQTHKIDEARRWLQEHKRMMTTTDLTFGYVSANAIRYARTTTRP